VPVICTESCSELKDDEELDNTLDDELSLLTDEALELDALLGGSATDEREPLETEPSFPPPEPPQAASVKTSATTTQRPTPDTCVYTFVAPNCIADTFFIAIPYNLMIL
jgi:hypothetical protein